MFLLLFVYNNCIRCLPRTEDKTRRDPEEEEEKMALQWLILSYVVAAEVVIAVVLTLPYPMVVKKRVVSLVSLVLQPAASIVAFAAFQLCGDHTSLFLNRF